MQKKLAAIIKPLVSICEREPAIAAAYIFGSCAKGNEKPTSDIDLAILLDETRKSQFSLLDFISTIEKKTGCDVDVVVLNTAGEVVKYEVRRHGRLIFERSSACRKAFEVRGRKSYEDFLYLHGRYVKSVLYGGADGRPNPS
jgi:predicted nucleotidyltransferase